MTDIDTIRILIADPIQHDRAVSVTTDASTVEFALPNAPVVDSSEKVYLDGTLTASYSIDYALGIVTLASAPAADVEVVITYNWSMLSDTDLQALLDLEDSIVKLAAAQALDTIADSETLIQKRITLLDIKTDGPAEARALREHAKALRAQVADGSGTDADGLFDYAEMALGPFGTRERMMNEYKRNGW